MDNLLNSGIQFIQWLQSLGAWLTPVMKLFTFLGNEQFYLLIAPAILWCIDSTLGLRLGLFLMINGAVNSAAKMAFHNPRPYWYTSEITVSSGAENSFGLPSGHAQNSVVVWGTIADKIKGRWAWIVTIFIMFMIGISRIYLAVHFPLDVLTGWLIGAVMLWVLLHFEEPVIRWIKKYSPGMQILITFIFSIIFIFIFLMIILVTRGWSLPVDWVNNAQLAFPESSGITPFSLHNTLSAPGAFFGMAAGWIWMTSQRGFSTKGEWWKLLARYILGVAGVLILYKGLSPLFPKNEASIAYILRYLRYAMIGFWISGLAPWLFVKLKLANHSQ